MYHLRKDNVPIGHDRDYREIVVNALENGENLEDLPRREYDDRMEATKAASKLTGLFPMSHISVERGPDPSVKASDELH